MAINLMYHDVTPRGLEDTSGFAGAEAARYKLTPDEFQRHLSGIAEAVDTAPHSSISAWSSTSKWAITFDDGGVSACTAIARALEDHGWRGWFFIATDFIGKPGFCSESQVRELHERGHVIGSHSCSHPERISACSPEMLAEEWSRSCRVLSRIIGQSILSASVPGGFYSVDVAKAAAAAGIRLLFTSEPTVTELQVDGCQVIGRYNIYRGMSPGDTVALMTSRFRRWRQSAFWTAKKVAKTWAAPVYKGIRSHVLRRAYRSARPESA